MPEKPSSACASDGLEALGIFDEEFPDNVSISDLCDCGRCKRKHANKPIIAQHKGPFPKTDYMSTYEAVKHPRPRSSKRPPMTARDPRPLPMFLSTNQKDDFKDLGHVERVKPIVHEDTYEPSTEPLDGLTYYAQEFTAKQVKSEPAVRQMSRRELIHREPAQFDDTTTNKQHFKRWVPQPALTFGELPSFTGSILFPQRENLPVSTMRQSFMGTWQPPAAQIKAADASIKLEGNQVFDTTHNATYQKIDGDHRAKQLIQKDTTPLQKRGQFLGKSQTMDDFGGYRGGQPRPPRAMDPPPATIDLKFNNKRSFSTENRTIYRGHNVMQHPAPISCKKEDEEYKLPSVKFETETSQKRDFQPIELKSSDYSKIKIPQSSMGVPVDAEFEGKTMNKEFFQDWGIQPRVRYGDFHENRPYIPPKDPFQGQSVTQTSYIPKAAEPVKFYKPEERPISKSGEINFQTVYQDEFQKKQARMCRAQVYLIQQELRRRKREKQQQQMNQQKTPQSPGGKCSSAPLSTHKPVPNTKATA
ncbi:uncharacterized protein LOC101864625 [Aplysia californica]|uniref:Uncharacterized protein LOC101864625 n=1 Tax=Aplysia californica TaxID=6500 RepID=A0ABM0JRW9_APLCA|nr:uncharacterized protein LOC101864625 [Aplysia californica]